MVTLASIKYFPLMIGRYNSARHVLPQKMVLEALEQNLIAISILLRTFTSVDNPNGSKAPGILGYPAAILLFSIVDTIGSYHANSLNPLEINIDEQIYFIDSRKLHTHFYILNSDYFGLNLKRSEIRAFYNVGRSTLMHNSTIGKELTLSPDLRQPFLEVNDCVGKGKYIVHLKEFYNVCRTAVELFKTRADDIFKNSRLGKSFQRT